MGGGAIGGLNKLNDSVGKAQGALFGLSVASSVLAGGNEKLGNQIQKIIGYVSVFAIALPLLTGAVGLATTAWTAVAAAGIGMSLAVGGVVVAFAALGAAAYLLYDAIKRTNEAEKQGAATEAQFKERRGQIGAKNRDDLDIAGMSPFQRERAAKAEKAYNSARDVTSRKRDDLRLLEDKKYVKDANSFTGLGQFDDMEQQIAAKRKAVAEAEAKQAILKKELDLAREAQKTAKEINSSNFDIVKEAASKTGFVGERSTKALEANAAAKKNRDDLNAQKSDLENQKQKLTAENKDGVNDDAIKGLNKQIDELKLGIDSASIAYRYSGYEIRDIADIINSGGQDLSVDLKFLKDSFVENTKKFTEAMKVVIENLRKEGEIIGLAKAITPASGQFSERTSNQLELSSLFSQTKFSQEDYKSRFSGLKDAFDPSSMIVSDAPEKKRQEALAKLKADSFTEDGKLDPKKEIARQEAEAKIQLAFQKELAAEQQAASKKARDSYKNLDKDVASGKLQNDLFTEFAKGGEEAFKKAFQSKFSTTNIEEGKGKELYDNLFEGAKGFKETIEQSYTTALNMETAIQNKIRDTGLELIEAQKKALSDITSMVKGILEGPKSDPTALFKKYEEAAKLLKTGDSKDAQKANQILSGAEKDAQAFRGLYGEESLMGMQERSGMTAGMFAKSKSSATMQMTDFGTIEDIIKNSLSGANQKRLSGAFEDAKTDPSKMSKFIDMVNQTFTGRLAEKGNQITGSLAQFDSAEDKRRSLANVDKQLYNTAPFKDVLTKDKTQAIQAYKQDPTKEGAYGKMLDQLTKLLGSKEKATKIAEAYKGAATQGQEFSAEDEASKSLTESQEKLKTQLNETTEMVNKFKIALDGKDGGITTSISALKLAIDDAATGVTGFKTLTQSLSDISNGIGPVLDKVKADIAELKKGSGK